MMREPAEQDKDALPTAAGFPRIPNTVEISGEAIASLDRWYIAAGFHPKPDGTYNKRSSDRPRK